MNPSSLSWQNMNVAVTGMNNRPDNPGPGYGVARCIREAEGFRGQIIGLGYDALDGGLYHREVCDAGFLLPYPSNSEEALLERLEALHAEHPFDVLIPTLDAELPAMIRLQPALARLGVRMLIPDSRQLHRRDKERLPELCERAGVVTPRTRVLTDPAFFDHCIHKGWPYPLVVKGCFYDARIVYTPEEAKSAFHRIASTWGLPVIVQAWMHGEEFDLVGLGDGAGGLAGAVMMRKKGLTENGKGWAGITIHHPELLAAAIRLVAALEWRGPLEIEMLRDGHGTFHLLEINPRFPAWTYLSHGAGCNLPARLLQTLTGETPAVAPAARSGVLFIRYAEELIVHLDQFARMTALGGDGCDLKAVPPAMPLPIAI